MNTPKFTPPVRRALHEMSDASPIAPSFDTLASRVEAHDVDGPSHTDILRPVRSTASSELARRGRFGLACGLGAVVVGAIVVAVSVTGSANSSIAPAASERSTPVPSVTPDTRITATTSVTAPPSPVDAPASTNVVSTPVTSVPTTVAPTSSLPAGVRAITQSCTGADFAASTPGPGDGAMGNIKLDLSLQNISGTACQMPDVATLAGIDKVGGVVPLDSRFGDTYFGDPPVIVGPLQAGATAVIWIAGGQPSFCYDRPVPQWTAMQLGFADASTVRFAPALESCGTPSMSRFGRPSSLTTPAHACPAPLSFPEALTSDRANSAAYDFATIHNDILTVATYGRAHQKDWAGYEITGDKPVRIKIWVTDNLTEHAKALGSILEHPDRVDLVAATYTTGELQTVTDAIVVDAQANPSAFTTFGGAPGGQVVEFGLAAGQEKLADMYILRYGSEVRITVGDGPYVPDGCGPQPNPRTCPDITGQDPSAADLTLSLAPQTFTITQSGYGAATLTVTNNGTTTYHLETDNPLIGTLVYPGTTRVAADGTDTKGTGLIIDLSPGQSQAINVAFSARRCDGQPGSAIPPGTYGLRVALVTHTIDGTPGTTFLSSETPANVIAN
jgi:hypothetical protein